MNGINATPGYLTANFGTPASVVPAAVNVGTAVPMAPAVSTAPIAGFGGNNLTGGAVAMPVVAANVAALPPTGAGFAGYPPAQPAAQGADMATGVAMMNLAQDNRQLQAKIEKLEEKLEEALDGEGAAAAPQQEQQAAAPKEEKKGSGLGKIIGGIAGGFFGGPAGAAVGSAAGEALLG